MRSFKLGQAFAPIYASGLFHDFVTLNGAIGYGYGFDDPDEILLNAAIAKSWSNATLTLKLYDLLNQKKNIVQVVGENYVQYKAYNTLPTYAMLTFTYKLNKMGKLKAKGFAGHMQEMMESGRQPGPPGGGNTPPPGPPPDIR